MEEEQIAGGEGVGTSEQCSCCPPGLCLTCGTCTCARHLPGALAAFLNNFYGAPLQLRPFQGCHLYQSCPVAASCIQE